MPDIPAKRLRQRNRLLGLVLGLSLVPILLTVSGANLGFNPGPLPSLANISPFELEQVLHHYQSSSVWATLLGWSSFCLALITAVLAVANYEFRHDATTPLLAMALLFSGLMDAVETLAGAGLVPLVANHSAFIPFAWAMHQLFIALLLMGACLLFMEPRFAGLLIRRELNLRQALIVAAGLGAVGMWVVSACATMPLPQALYPNRLANRPWDLAPLVAYALAGSLVFPAFHRRHPSMFAYALILSALPCVAAELHLVFGSDRLYDHHAVCARLLFLLAGAILLAGLVQDYLLSAQEDRAALKNLEAAQRKLHEQTRQLELSREELMRVLEERKSAEAALQVLDRAIASSSCGIIITDPRAEDNPVIYVNPAFERITGYSSAETVGRNCRFLRHGDQDQEGLRKLAAALRQQRECRVIVRNYRKDSSMFWNDLDVSPVPDENGQLIHYLGIMTDITDRIRAEQDLRGFAQRLEARNRELQDFVHVASHDLQEPLRKVRVFSDRLLKLCGSALPEEGRVYIERMLHAIQRMETLIKDLLTYSRITRRTQTFQPLDLTQTTREVLNDLEVRIEETGANITLGPLPTISADPTQMRQLMQNLLSNALKFRRRDVPPVIQIVGELLDGGRCRLTVTDNGIGFDEKYLDRIFTVFQRLHSATEYEGTGVGLTVCRKIVERHGGDITAKSKPGEGATFIVTLPVEPRNLPG